MAFVGPFEGTYENKKFMNDDVGPSTGCALNAVWFYEMEPSVATSLGWANLESIFRQHRAPPGLYDINAVIDENGDAWFLEWTSRLGFDSEPTSACLVSDLGMLLHGVATGGALPGFDFDDVAYAIRLTVPPYPWEHAEKGQKGSPDGRSVRGVKSLWQDAFIGYNLRKVDGRLEVAGPEGIVGLAIAVGDDLERLDEQTLDAAESIECAGLQYRTDGAANVAEAAKELLDAGVEVPTALTS